MVFNISFGIYKHLLNTVYCDIVLIIHFLTKKTFIFIFLFFLLLCGLQNFFVLTFFLIEDKNQCQEATKVSMFSKIIVLWQKSDNEYQLWYFKLYNCAHKCIDQHLNLVAALSGAKSSSDKGRSKKRMTDLCLQQWVQSPPLRLFRQITCPWRKCSEF